MSDSVAKVKEDLIHYTGNKTLVRLITYESLYGYLKQLEIELPNSQFIKKAVARLDVLWEKSWQAEDMGF